MNSLDPNSDWRAVLRSALALRSSRNPAYSQRAFARDLGLAPGRLSEVLAGREGLSRKTAHDVALCLGLSGKEASIFCDMVEASHARSKSARQAARNRLVQRRQTPAQETITAARFAMIRDWIHLGIVELAKTRGFRWEPRWMARRLGVTVSAVRLALRNLVECGIVAAKDGDGYTLRSRSHRVESQQGPAPSEAIREFHRQILDRARASIEEQSPVERELQSLIIALNDEQLEDLRAEVRACVERASAKAATNTSARSLAAKPSHLYALSIQLFRLTTLELTKDRTLN